MVQTMFMKSQSRDCHYFDNLWHLVLLCGSDNSPKRLCTLIVYIDVVTNATPNYLAS